MAGIRHNPNEEIKAKTTNPRKNSEIDIPLPEFIKVTHAAKILELSPETIRKYCYEGKLEAIRNYPDSGMWRIKTNQPIILNGVRWDEFVNYCRREQQKSKR